MPPRGTPKVNCGLRLVMMHQCGFLSSNTESTLVGEEEAMAVRGQGYMGTLYLPLCFAVNLKLL